MSRRQVSEGLHVHMTCLNTVGAAKLQRQVLRMDVTYQFGNTLFLY